MTATIGVRDLKNRTSEIVREVQENGAEFIVTLRGAPVAVLRPFPTGDEGESRIAQREAALERLDALAEKIAASWLAPESAVDLIEKQRR
jgi:prevent-host-death family protein